MLACFGEKTGLAPDAGCDLSVRLYAAAAQVYALYVQAEWVIRQAFPQTAEQDYLDRHAQLRGLVRKPPTAARGIIRFFLNEASDTPRPIPKGTVCMTTGAIRFETTEDGVIPAQQTYADIPACALAAGSEGNVAAHTVKRMAVAPVGIVRCDNPSPFLGGADTELDSELRKRVLDTFLRLPNGANAAYYEQMALSFHEVAAVSVIPRSRGVGTVDVVVATQSGLPNEDLIKQLGDYFQERREIAVDVQVHAPTTVSTDVNVRIKPKPGVPFSTLSPQVEHQLRAWFSGERLGKPLLLAELGHLIYSLDGVENYSIVSPSTDLKLNRNQLPTLGKLTLEEMT